MTEKAKSVCYLAPDVPIPSPRGSSVHVVELSQNLASLGYEVHVICRRTGASQPKMERIQNFTVHRVSRKMIGGGSMPRVSEGKDGSASFFSRLYYLYLISIYRLYIAMDALNLMRKFRLESIIERETSFGAGAIASLLSGAPMILEIIGPRYSRTSVWRSKTVLYYTETMLRSWVDRKKCVAVPAGVNLKIFRVDIAMREKIRSELKLAQQNFVIGYVGTFQIWHGVDTLIDAFKKASQINPDLKLLLVGQNFEPFEKRCKQSGVANNSIFVGSVNYEKVAEYINACDLMTALYEPQKDPLRAKYGIGWPLKILEYMACGKPTISTRVDPVTRIITNDADGFLVEPEEPDQLAALLASLYDDKQKLDEIGEHSRLLVQEKYSWATLAKTISGFL